ncbi:MAG: hypothetical protein PHH54_06105 [Candidatus Nanoarchaeia archaeon]|nr:hypothetical protein [Candidatus Nanoarchaeia archaeon]
MTVDIYMQTGNTDKGRIGIIGVSSIGNNYIAYVYDLIMASLEKPAFASLRNTIKFNSGKNGDNYNNFQKFVKKQTGAEALFFDPDNGYGPNRLTVSGALEQALKNHVIFD